MVVVFTKYILNKFNSCDTGKTLKLMHYKWDLTSEIGCFVCNQFTMKTNYDYYDHGRHRTHVHCAILPKTVKHEKHIHNLTLHAPIEKEKTFYVGNVCNLCEEERDPETWLYYCEKCDFPGHLSCGLLGSPVPRKGILTSNSIYAIEGPSLAEEKEKEYIGALEIRAKRIKENLEPLGELVHFSHEHSLSLFKDVWDEETSCTACRMPVYGMVYSCEECRSNEWFTAVRFSLHKWCAELPQQVHFGFHFEHPLTLLPTDKLGCSYCRRAYDAFSYCCLECGFGVHTTCAFLSEIGLHKSHDHPLEVMSLRSKEDYRSFIGRFSIKSGKTVPCSACLFPCHGLSLGCNDCGFYLHVPCYLYPTTRKADRHRHNLNLIFAYQEPYTEFICDACEKPRTPGCWVYCCPDPKCYIVAHLDCGEPNLFPSSSSNGMIKHQENCYEYHEERDPNDWVYYCPSPSLYLRHGLERPNLDQPIHRILKSDPVYAFLKENVTGNMRKAEELQHFSHEHLLVLCDEKWNGEMHCEACSRGIYGKTYSCHECGYYLHKWCVQMPREQHFKCHSEHPLTILPKHHFNCVCKAISFGFSYSCAKCDFEADTLCVLKPDRNLVSHKHPTDIMVHMPQKPSRFEYSLPDGGLPLCSACRFPCEGMTIECRSCDFHLHVGCAWYPRSSKIEAHKHSLILADSVDLPDDVVPISDRYLCDVCDKRLTEYGWGYVCVDEKSNLTAAHLDCAVPNPFLASESFKGLLLHQDE